MKKYYFGVDIGGTKIEYALFNDNFDLLTKERIPTQRENGYQSVMSRLADGMKGILSSNDITLNQLIGIGVGLPGTIDPQTKRMINGNSKIFIGQDFVGDLRSLFYPEIEVRVANDANLFALAEHHKGAGLLFEREKGIPQHQQNSVGIILGTGNGGGLILGGKIFEGKHGGGAEVGHHILYNNGRPCYCGRKGCAEQYLCGPSIESNYYKQTGEKLRASEVFEQRNAVANGIKNQYKHDLCEFLTNLSTLFDPDYFVLGGGISTIDVIYEGLEEKLWDQVFVRGTKPRVFKHVIGDSAGVLGASMLFHGHLY